MKVSHLLAQGVCSISFLVGQDKPSHFYRLDIIALRAVLSVLSVLSGVDMLVLEMYINRAASQFYQALEKTTQTITQKHIYYIPKS